MVVYRFVTGLNQISWLPAACRSKAKPNCLSRLQQSGSEIRQVGPSSIHDKGIIKNLVSGWKREIALAFLLGFQKFFGDVTSNFQSFLNRPPLCHKPWQLIGSGQVHTLR